MIKLPFSKIYTVLIIVFNIFSVDSQLNNDIHQTLPDPYLASQMRNTPVSHFK